MAVGRVSAVPRSVTQYRVFIGSPGGLDEDRKAFRHKLLKYTELHSEPRNVAFHPVGWEETVGGVGRPQELINEDLKQCDYAVFVLHDRWGSRTGDVYTSGFEEELALAEELYKANKVRNIALFFKKVDPRQLRDPGEQLGCVLAFQKRTEDEKRYLYRRYETVDEFVEALEAYLSRWLRDHEGVATGVSLSSSPTTGTTIGTAEASFSDAPPGFGYWIKEADRRLEPDTLDYSAALFCAKQAVETARSDIEWARAMNALGVVQVYLGAFDEAIAAFRVTTQGTVHMVIGGGTSLPSNELSSTHHSAG